MIYRDNLFLNARFQEAVQAAHDQDWQTFEKYSFYDAKMMEDLLYKCEHLMPLEIKCRYALQHYYSHLTCRPMQTHCMRCGRIQLHPNVCIQEQAALTRFQKLSIRHFRCKILRRQCNRR